jgi:hypothetical protein
MMWLPSEMRIGAVSGVAATWTLSTSTRAPSGVVVTLRRPIRAF